MINTSRPSPLYHIAKRADWLKSQEEGLYRVSTLNKRLDEVGYIHLSYGHQVKMVADFLYKEQDDLVLLRISPEELTSEVIIEPVDGTDELFPHLYGPLNIESVKEVLDFTLQKDSSFPEIT